jgi:hypothetical protein
MSDWSNPKLVARIERITRRPLRTCPWNTDHNITASKLENHIARCTFRPADAWMCRFHSSHGFSNREDRDLHYAECDFKPPPKRVSFKENFNGDLVVQRLNPTEGFLKEGLTSWPERRDVSEFIEVPPRPSDSYDEYYSDDSDAWSTTGSTTWCTTHSQWVQYNAGVAPPLVTDDEYYSDDSDAWSTTGIVGNPPPPLPSPHQSRLS